MFSKKLGALVAASLVVATTPAAAQTSARSLSLNEDVRASTSVSNESELGGGGVWAAILGVALLAAFVLVVIEDDDVDLPDSP
ncbi:MAG TPA: hypothetical protein VGD10_01205 [Allosphingosinicella sp.]|uniref:hypothetical protein n=1 Tax=Allosphingosinicella sp. TaxID=2823234 RepID=UPI002ED8FC73